MAKDEKEEKSSQPSNLEVNTSKKSVDEVEDVPKRDYGRNDDKRRGEKVSSQEKREAAEILQELKAKIEVRDGLISSQRRATSEAEIDKIDEEILGLIDQARKIVPGLGQGVGKLQRKFNEEVEEQAQDSNPGKYKIDYSSDTEWIETFFNGQIPIDHLRATALLEVVHQNEKHFVEETAKRNAELYGERQKIASPPTRKPGEPVKEMSGGAGEAFVKLGAQPPKDADNPDDPNNPNNILHNLWAQLNQATDPARLLMQSYEMVMNLGIARGLSSNDLNNPTTYDLFFRGFQNWFKELTTEEQRAGMGIIGSEEATQKFLRDTGGKIDPVTKKVIPGSADSEKAREWVYDKIQEMIIAAAPDGGFQNAYFAPYLYLTGADYAIRVAGGEMLWQEIHYFFTMYGFGNACKSCGDLKELQGPAQGVVAENFDVLLKTKGKYKDKDGNFIKDKNESGKTIEDPEGVNLVAMALRLFEKHELEYANNHPNNFTTFQKAIAWELMGYDWGSKDDPNTALWLARNDKQPRFNEWAPIQWAVAAAHSIRLASFQAVATIPNAYDSYEDKTNAICYPAFRLQKMDEDRKVVRFFRRDPDPRAHAGSEGRKYVRPYLETLWYYMASSSLKSEGDNENGEYYYGGARELRKTGNQSLIKAGLLIKVPLYHIKPDGTKGGLVYKNGEPQFGYVIKEKHLSDVRFELIDWNKNEPDAQFQSGIMPKYMAYLIRLDMARAMLLSEKKGLFTHPTMDTLAATIADADPWEKTEPRSKREIIYCNLAEGIIEFNIKREKKLPDGSESYAERDFKGGQWSVPFNHHRVVHEMAKLLAYPFQIDMRSQPFQRLMAKFHVTEKDLQPRKDFLAF